MSVVAFTAGSLGDIFNVVGLVVKVANKLYGSVESRRQHGETIRELNAFHRTLILTHDVATNLTNRSPQNGLALSTLALIRAEVDECHSFLRSFMCNLNKYEGLPRRPGIRGLWGSVWWSLWEEGEVRELRQHICRYMQRITMLLTALNSSAVGNVDSPIRSLTSTVEHRQSSFVELPKDLTWMTPINGVSRQDIQSLISIDERDWQQVAKIQDFAFHLIHDGSCVDTQVQSMIGSAIIRFYTLQISRLTTVFVNILNAFPRDTIITTHTIATLAFGGGFPDFYHTAERLLVEFTKETKALRFHLQSFAKSKYKSASALREITESHARLSLAVAVIPIWVEGYLSHARMHCERIIKHDTTESSKIATTRIASIKTSLQRIEHEILESLSRDRFEEVPSA